jgi:CheY-like chemotaxis protein
MPITILLVEDDDVAAEAVTRNLKKLSVDYPIVHANDGKEALDILLKQHPEKNIDKPFLVLLDLNMPRMNGFEFLNVVRNDNHLKDTVIFVLTTSDDDKDRSRAYHECIAGYMVKSSIGPQFAKLAALLESYKLAVKLPK